MRKIVWDTWEGPAGVHLMIWEKPGAWHSWEKEKNWHQMDLVAYWCVQVASKHKVLFQQQLLSPSQCGHKHCLYRCWTFGSWGEDIYWAHSGIKPESEPELWGFLPFPTDWVGDLQLDLDVSGSSAIPFSRNKCYIPNTAWSWLRSSLGMSYKLVVIFFN